MITDTTIVGRRQGIVSDDIDGEAVMMSLETGKYYNMDPIATRIWHLLATPTKVADLTAILMNEYEVTRETCEQDVLELLNGLCSEKLVEIVS